MPLRAATAVAALAFLASPLATTSHAADAPAADDGCITEWGGLGQYAIDFDRFQYNTVHVNPDGSVYVQPMTPVSLAAFIAGHSAGQVVLLVTCIV